MSDTDPIDFLSTPEPVDTAGAIAGTEDEADVVTLSRAELQELQDSAKRVEDLNKTLEDLKMQALTNRFQPQAISQPAPQQQAPTRSKEEVNAAFWQDAGAAATAIADERVRETVIPIAKQIASNLGNTAIGQFKMGKMNDSFYNVVADTFDSKISQLNLEWLGSLTPEQQKSTLKEAWNAAVGEYVDTERGKRPTPKPPTNLGGGGSTPSAKSKGAKTLEQLDRPAYIWAVRNGWTAEQMAEAAKEIQDELEAQQE